MSDSKELDGFVEREYRRIGTEFLKHALHVQSEVLRAAGRFLRGRGFVEILPVIISPLTDPLRHATGRAEIEHNGSQYQLTRSMIFQKQIALLAHDRVFAFSPNIRMEPTDYAQTGRHLIEFTQLDLEVRGGTREALIDLAEDLLIHVLAHVQERCAEALAFFGRELVLPTKPFQRIAFRQARERHGQGFEVAISRQQREPVWIVDMTLDVREFYDREDPDRPGILVDMDLLYPEGFGEALSGGEREHTPDRIRQRIGAMGLDPQDYALYLGFAEQGLPPSAGFGIGMERLTRFICGLGRIEEGVLFPKVPGQPSL